MIKKSPGLQTRASSSQGFLFIRVFVKNFFVLASSFFILILFSKLRLNFVHYVVDFVKRFFCYSIKDFLTFVFCELVVKFFFIHFSFLLSYLSLFFFKSHFNRKISKSQARSHKYSACHSRSEEHTSELQSPD